MGFESFDDISEVWGVVEKGRGDVLSNDTHGRRNVLMCRSEYQIIYDAANLPFARSFIWLCLDLASGGSLANTST